MNQTEFVANINQFTWWDYVFHWSCKSFDVWEPYYVLRGSDTIKFRWLWFQVTTALHCALVYTASRQRDHGYNIWFAVSLEEFENLIDIYHDQENLEQALKIAYSTDIKRFLYVFKKELFVRKEWLWTLELTSDVNVAPYYKIELDNVLSILTQLWTKIIWSKLPD